MEEAQKALLNIVMLSTFNLNAKAMIMAQCEHESAGFSCLEESFAYTPERLLEVFPRRVTTIKFARSTVSKGAEAIANLVYSDRMGNGDQNTGDGWKYRGRGLIQITGRSNYFESGKYIKIDLLNNPDKAKEPVIASKIALAFFKNRPWLLKAASAGNVLESSSWINFGNYKTGQNEIPLGLHDRENNFRKWLKKLSLQTS